MTYIISIYSILFLVGILFDLCGQWGLHVVRVVLDVVVLQDRLQASALLPALLGMRHFGRQAFWREKRLLRWGQLARLDDIFDCVLNGAALLLAAFVLLALVFFWWIWMLDCPFRSCPRGRRCI